MLDRWVLLKLWRCCIDPFRHSRPPGKYGKDTLERLEAIVDDEGKTVTRVLLIVVPWLHGAAMAASEQSKLDRCKTIRYECTWKNCLAFYNDWPRKGGWSVLPGVGCERTKLECFRKGSHWKCIVLKLYMFERAGSAFAFWLYFVMVKIWVICFEHVCNSIL